MNDLPINEQFLQQVELLQLLVKNNVAGQFGGTHKAKTYGSSCEFNDYRDYIAGDDIKKIDWNAYARFEKLYLKLYLDERQMQTKIYIDVSRSMGHGAGEKGRQAIRLAAALAYISVCDMDKVSIYLIRGGAIEEIIHEMLGRDRYFNEISALNGIVFEGDSRISEAILPAKVGYGDGMSIIISDFLTDENFESGIDYLASKKRDIFCIQVLSKEELNPKVRGKMHLFDCEDTSKSYRKNINKEIIGAYKMALKYATERVRDYCHSRGAEYILISTEEDLSAAFFGRMGELGVTK